MKRRIYHNHIENPPIVIPPANGRKEEQKPEFARIVESMVTIIMGDKILPFMGQANRNINYLFDQLEIIREVLQIMFPGIYPNIYRNVKYRHEVEDILRLKDNALSEKAIDEFSKILNTKAMADPLKSGDSTPLFDIIVMGYYKEKQKREEINKVESEGQIPDYKL